MPWTSESWTEMGEAGRRRVESEFDINRLNDALVERIRPTLAGRKVERTRLASGAHRDKST